MKKVQNPNYYATKTDLSVILLQWTISAFRCAVLDSLGRGGAVVDCGGGDTVALRTMGAICDIECTLTLPPDLPIVFLKAT